MTGSPAAVWTANGMPGCSMPPAAASVAGAGPIAALMSASGTAYVGTTRRGSHTSSARVLSSAGSSPIVARTRFAVGS